MSKKKRTEQQETSDEKPNQTTEVSAVKSRRLRIPTITTMTTIVIAAVIWLGLHSTGVTSGVESTVQGESVEVKPDVNQPAEAITGGPSIHFAEPSHDFGTITQGAKVTHTFVVTNNGDEPLKLIRAKGS